MKFLQTLLVAIAAALISASCTRQPQASPGMYLHNSPEHRYYIESPTDACSTSTSNESDTEIHSITDNNGNFTVQILALAAGKDQRFKYDLYNRIDTMYYSALPPKATEEKSFWSEDIVRTYNIDSLVTLQTTSKYCMGHVYVIYAKYNSDGKDDALKIAKSFSTSSGIGPTNFVKRKLFNLLGDGKAGSGTFSFLYTIVYSIMLFFGFGIAGMGYAIGSEKNVVLGVVCAAVFLSLFMALFFYLAVNEQLMGYLYGHNSLGDMITGVLDMISD